MLDQWRRVWLCPATLRILALVLSLGGESRQALQCGGIPDGCGCDFGDGSGTIDVSDISNTDGTPKFKDIAGDDDHLYSYNPCQPFSEGSCSSAAVCQMSSDGKTFVQIGDAGTARWTYEENPNRTVTIYYEHSDPGPPPVLWESFVTYICDPSATTARMNVTGSDGTAVYYFQVTTKCACPGACSRNVPSHNSGELSGGSVVLIVFFVLLFVYLTTGMIFKRAKENASGIELVPNIDFWRELPGYIKDGFLLVTCRSGSVKDRYVEVN